MDHWSYYTDDDEPTKKESPCDAPQTQSMMGMERTSADFRKPHPTVAAAISNAPDDPSWADLEPHPENARPPPRMDPPAAKFSFAPMQHGSTAAEQTSDDEDYRNPNWPPGVIDISEHLRRRHKERLRVAKWAQLQVKPGTASANQQSQPLRREEPTPCDDARERTTRNCERKDPRPLPSANSDVWRREEPHGNRLAPWHGLANACPRNHSERRDEPTPWNDARERTTRNGERREHSPLPSPYSDGWRRSESHGNRPALWHWRQPSSSEHPSDGLAGPHMGSTRHRGGGGPCHHPRKGRPYMGSAKPYQFRRSSEPHQGRYYQSSHGWRRGSGHDSGWP